MGGIGRRAGTLLAALVLVSAAIRFAASLTFDVPWISPDELLYGLAGESLWTDGTLGVRGLEAPYTSLVTPALVGAPLAAFGLDGGIGVAQALQSLVMAYAAIPVFLWARGLVGPAWALLASALTLLVPGLVYGGTLMTEAAFYPLAVAALASGALLLEHPTLLRQGAFFGLVTLAAAVRMQALVLIPALVVAVLVHAWITRSWRTARALAPIGGVAIVGAVAAASVAALSGTGTVWDDLLGAYRPVVETSTSPVGALGSIAAHGLALALVSLVLPLVATVVVSAAVLRRREQGPLAAFVAVALGYLPLLVIQVGVFAAQNVQYVSQRYLLTAAPVLFVGFAVWLQRGAPLPRLAAGATAALVLLGALLVPVGDLVPETGVHDALWTTWLQGLAVESEWAARAVLAGAAAAVLAVLLVPRHAVVRASAAAVAVGLLALSIDATRAVAEASEREQRTMVGSSDPTWIPSSLGGTVLLASGDHHWSAVSRTFFWNPAVTAAVRLGDAEVRVPPSAPEFEIGLDGVLRTPDGATLDGPLVLSPATLSLDGELVAQRFDTSAETPGWRLWRARDPVRVTTRVVGALPNGDFSGELTALAPGCRRGALELTLLGKSGDPIVVTVDGIPWGEIQAPDGVVVTRRVPAPPYADGTHTCVFNLATEGYAGSTRIEYVPAG